NNRTGDGGAGDALSGYSGSGGGIYTDGNESICQTYLTNCTIVYNSVGEFEEIWTGESYGGGLYTGGGVVDLIATIVANNRLSQTGCCGPDGYGIFNTRGYNLVKDMSCVDFYSGQPGEIFNEDPLLGPLAENGGPTQTHALLSGSPAIDAGKATGLTIDQRGFSRPIDIPGISNVADGSDIGAYEYVPTFVISGKITYWDTITGMEGVNLSFSNNGGDASTDKFGVYSHSVPQGWSGTVTPSKQGYKFTPVSRTYSSIQSDRLNQNYSAQPLILPAISLNRTHLNFGFVKDGNQSGSQTFSITNSGGGMLNWELDDDANWMVCNPTNGVDKGTVTVTVETGGLASGTYSGSVTITAPNAANSPQKVNVTLVIYETNTSGGPFGYFETPTDGATVYGSIPVTGWALDDTGVESVKIYRALNEHFVYIGDAVFIEGARPDVELAYPSYPNNYKAGWGYMLLTNVLPNAGNGTFTLHALAWDKEGHQVDLGWKTINVDNAHAVKPFGAIDTPTQGGKAAGSSYRNAGWVLTPQPNKIPEDGHTISVWIDGKKIGNPFYNIYRQDVAALFPGYANSNGAHAYLDFDTASYENGMHTIMWIAEDNAGNSEGIGSRYFTVENLSGDKNPDNKPGFPSLSLSMSEVDTIKTIEVQKGFQANNMQTLYLAERGDRVIEITELMPLEIRLEAGKARPGIKETLDIKKEEKWGAFLKVGECLRKLPIGSCFDSDKGIFYWHPGPGFLGTYPLIFIKKDKNGILKKCELTIKVIPKF
ncbi:MAG: BACON domain-containing protein, partial [Acidobacteria bacterium]|nr:BACON domain-containing protein [Acidobacteriota bacterium]